MSPTTKDEKDEMAKVPFKQIVGALIYLASQTRPDIAVALSEVCRFMANPGRQHWIAVKRILRYIKGTLEYGIAFSGKFDQVIGYADSDWGNNIDCRRSRTGFLFFANGPVSWESRLQTTVALSTVEAEYLALAAATKNALWLRTMLSELGFMPKQPTTIWQDNQGCIALAKDPVNHRRTKHIDIRHHFVKDAVARGDIKLKWCSTSEMLADVLTKALPVTTFKKLRQLIMGAPDEGVC